MPIRGECPEKPAPSPARHRAAGVRRGHRVARTAHRDARLAVDLRLQRDRGVEGLGGERSQRGPLGLRRLTDGGEPAGDVAGVVCAVGRLEQRVQLGQALDARDRHEVAPAEAPDLALHTPLPARPAPLRRTARAPLRAGARPCAGAHRLRPRPRWRSTPPAGAPGYDQRHDRQRRCAHRPARADREAGGALEGVSTGPTAGTLDARHRPAARHLTQHHQEVRPRRRPTRAPGCGIIYHQRPPKRTFSLNR